MISNLWNTQSPTKRIDLYFKIDDYKKHLLHLKNAKSTFKKSSPFFFSKNYQFENNSSLKLKLKNNKLQHKSSNMTQSDVQSARINTQTVQSQRNNHLIPYRNRPLDMSKMSSSIMSPTASPNKYQKFIDRQINQENKKILKKLQNVKASPQLSKKKLFHKYSNSDMKYKINLQKTKYKNVDFTKQAERLIKGQRIKFSKIKVLSSDIRKKQNFKIYQINLDWKPSKSNVVTSNSQYLNFPKAIR